MKLKLTYLFFLLMIKTTTTYSQVNLVPNPSFEVYDTCPNSASQISYAPPWFSPTTGTPDYYNSCFDFSKPWSGVVSVPLNLLGFQNTHTGNAYAGFYASYSWSTIYREYVEVMLSSPLISNTKYCVSFFVSLSDSSIYATDAIGLYFSTDSLLSTNYDALHVVPQVENLSRNYIKSKTTWTLVSGEYVAQGGENFITIGNFKNNINTTSIFIGGGDSTNSDNTGGYYYIDDVSITDCGSIVFQIPNIVTNNNDGINDVFLIKGLQASTEVSIYNRWGNRIYHANDYKNDWKPPDDECAGTYYYLITTPDAKTYKGFLELINN